MVKSTDATDVTSDAAKLTVTKADDRNGDIIGDLVDDENGDPVKDATVKLMKYGTDGTQFGATVTTDEDGKFKFTDIPYGVYSLVAQKDTSIVTRMIIIEAANNQANLIMPSGIKLTKVVIEGSDTPSVAVGNMEAMFTAEDTVIAKTPGAAVEIKLLVEKVTAPTDKTEIDNSIDTDIQEVGIYLDVKLIRTITGAVANAGIEAIQPPMGERVRIVLDLPEALQDKSGYVILRSHEGNVGEITPIYDAMLKTLSFEADAFSTYAVVFNKVFKYSYSVTVIDGGTGATGDGDYVAGGTVNINAGTKNGYTFDTWTTADGVTFADASSVNTAFTMPANNVTVTANWKSNGGGDNPNGGGGSDRDEPSKPGENIKVTTPDHGDVTVKPTAPKPGDVVIITPKPDDGYQTKDVVVTGPGGKDILVKDNGDGSWSYTQISGEVTITVIFEKKLFPFTDVTNNDWFYDSVKIAYENGWMDGSSATTFSPYLSTTRGMITTILWCIEGKPEDESANPFADVFEDTYYTKAVAWGAENIIVKGYGDGSFGPNDPVTREQLAAILHRYSQWKGLDTTATDDLSNFTDRPSAWALEDVRWAVGTGLVRGKGNGILDPTGHATKAETASMLERFVK